MTHEQANTSKERQTLLGLRKKIFHILIRLNQFQSVAVYLLLPLLRQSGESWLSVSLGNTAWMLRYSSGSGTVGEQRAGKKEERLVVLV